MLTETPEVMKMSLRLPTDMHAALTAWAKRERRSLHAHILWILAQALKTDKETTNA